MRRKFATAAITLFAVGALASPATATATAFDGAAKGNDSANCLGVERGERNRAGGDREKAMAAGCDDFDTKPVELPRLLGKIRALLPSPPATPPAA